LQRTEASRGRMGGGQRQRGGDGGGPRRGPTAAPDRGANTIGGGGPCGGDDSRFRVNGIYCLTGEFWLSPSKFGGRSAMAARGRENRWGLE